MLLGKRQRPPIKRTTSMTEITFDLSTITESEINGHQQPQPFDPNNPFVGLDQRFMTAASVSPRPRRTQRRNSADFVETAPFLKACFLCKRRLIPGRDIYMYRGDSAFCSLECRQQQMNQDEKKDNKCSLTAAASAKKDQVGGISIATVGGSNVSTTKGSDHTVAAAV